MTNIAEKVAEKAKEKFQNKVTVEFDFTLIAVVLGIFLFWAPDGGHSIREAIVHALMK